MEKLNIENVINDIKKIVNKSRIDIAKEINNKMLIIYWEIGRIIVEHEQNGNMRADYGKNLLIQLSRELIIGIWQRIFEIKSSKDESYVCCISKLPGTVWRIKLVSL